MRACVCVFKRKLSEQKANRSHHNNRIKFVTFSDVQKRTIINMIFILTLLSHSSRSIFSQTFHLFDFMRYAQRIYMYIHSCHEPHSIQILYVVRVPRSYCVSYCYLLFSLSHSLTPLLTTFCTLYIHVSHTHYIKYISAKQNEHSKMSNRINLFSFFNAWIVNECLYNGKHFIGCIINNIEWKSEIAKLSKLCHTLVLLNRSKFHRYACSTSQIIIIGTVSFLKFCSFLAIHPIIHTVCALCKHKCVFKNMYYIINKLFSKKY